MKLKFATVLLSLMLTVNLIAEESPKPQNQNSTEKELLSIEKSKNYSSTFENWTIFQLALFPGVPGVTYNSAVYGLKIGLPMSGGKGCVGGVEMSLISSTTARVYGIQMSPFVNIADSLGGLQMCMITNATDEMNGLQLSLINSSKSANGIQLGLVNVDKESMSGIQTGIFNFAEIADGLQLGLVNISRENGIQLGLINIIRDGWLPFFPLINISL